eukprot:TRINITY_DN2293_c0_g1_i2.p1 TRINITY_DN2293_c0_g1~~TRINITY_DN2293_c0_g1_i2.p1  ORF type:complete len:163 (-),score=39.30 TRINITY_DN2293_c0_g1_i2:656-1144(-)
MGQDIAIPCIERRERNYKLRGAFSFSHQFLYPKEEDVRKLEKLKAQKYLFEHKELHELISAPLPDLELNTILTNYKVISFPEKNESIFRGIKYRNPKTFFTLKQAFSSFDDRNSLICIFEKEETMFPEIEVDVIQKVIPFERLLKNSNSLNEVLQTLDFYLQ